MIDINFETHVAKKYCAVRQSAERRGIEFNINLTTIRNILKSKRCYYTGVILNNIQDDDNQLTIDRVDNTKGYVIGNVVACSKKFNLRKHSLTPKEIQLLYKKVIHETK